MKLSLESQETLLHTFALVWRRQNKNWIYLKLVRIFWTLWKYIWKYFSYLKELRIECTVKQDNKDRQLCWRIWSSSGNCAADDKLFYHWSLLQSWVSAFWSSQPPRSAGLLAGPPADIEKPIRLTTSDPPITRADWGKGIEDVDDGNHPTWAPCIQDLLLPNAETNPGFDSSGM